MCHFITAVLPASADVQQVQEIAKKFHRAWQPIKTGAVVGQLRVGETYYLTTPGHCDCGTVLGQASRAASVVADSEREIHRLRKKGWSETKIERWLADKTQADKRRQERTTATGAIDARHWLELLRAAVASGATPRIGLLLHWYTGSIADADLQFTRVEVRLSEAKPEFLLMIEEDRLYEFSM